MPLSKIYVMYQLDADKHGVVKDADKQINQVLALYKKKYKKDALVYHTGPIKLSEADGVDPSARLVVPANCVCIELLVIETEKKVSQVENMQFADGYEPEPEA